LKKDLKNEHDKGVDELAETLRQECDAETTGYKKKITTEYKKGISELQKYLRLQCKKSAMKLKKSHAKAIKALKD